VRKTLFNLHLYSSLASGLILVVVCATGCLLVWELSMDRWLDPDMSYVEPRGETVPFARILDGLKSRFPDQQVTEMDLGGPGTSAIAKLSDHDRAFRAFVNPYTGEFLGTRPGEPPSFWLRHVHRELVGGKAGVQVVRTATFLILFQSLSGLYLWWPLKRITVKWSGSFRRVSFDLHHAVGFFSCVFVCIIAITGLVKSYGDGLQPFFNRVTGDPALNKDMPSTPDLNRKITMDDAVARARAELPGAAIARLTPPKGRTGSFLVTMKYPGDSTAPGRSWVVVDQYNGRVLGSQDARTAPLAARIPIVNRAIHVGGISGAPSRALAFAATFALLLQLFTGVTMWWRRRAGKPAADVRKASPVGA
jgi:uncharacterized iron-regulated membrane protein